MSYTEFNKISTFPKYNSFQRVLKARKEKTCDGCNGVIHLKEMYVKLKRKFGGKFEQYHIRCPSQDKEKLCNKN